MGDGALDVPSSKRVYFSFVLLKLCLGGRGMHDKKEENAAAKMAWQIFEKTGRISNYMLYYELMRKK